MSGHEYQQTEEEKIDYRIAGVDFDAEYEPIPENKLRTPEEVWRINRKARGLDD